MSHSLRGETILRPLGHIDPFELYVRLRQRAGNSFILEDLSAPHGSPARTIIGFEPAARYLIRNGSHSTDGEHWEPLDDPVGNLREILATHARPSAPDGPLGRYNGGLVGSISYEFARRLDIGLPSFRSVEEPELELGLFLDGIVCDPHRGAFYFSQGEDRFPLIEQALKDDPPPLSAPPPIDAFCSDLSPAQFREGVTRIREHIRSGDVYQAVLSRRLSAPFDGELLPIYHRLRSINPSPYLYHLELDDRVISGSSPEMLCALFDGTVVSRPIAGTRPLGTTPEQRQRFGQELLADEKELAEHAMLVDLARNDVGKVARYGSVEVPLYREVQPFSHVQHLVSQVEGQLQPELDALDVLAATFPAGTVSGAPKRRAMEILSQLEASSRGPYAGAIGYLALNGNMDLAITIRTLWVDRTTEMIHLRAGAGIVYDSDPQREWEETEHKLAPLKEALRS